MLECHAERKEQMYGQPNVARDGKRTDGDELLVYEALDAAMDGSASTTEHACDFGGGTPTVRLQQVSHNEVVRLARCPV